MYQIDQPDPSAQFKEAWIAAGKHIQKSADFGLGWLRATLNPPFAEHLSFRIGNQIFFVFVDAVEFSYSLGNDLFDRVCAKASAIPLVMPMREVAGKWRPVNPGWGLQHAESGLVVNPLDYVSEELIEMTDWEIHDFAIQIVCAKLEQDGKKVFDKQPSPEIDPSIWFASENKRYYVIVRAARYPAQDVEAPDIVDAIKSSLISEATCGYFAYVIAANREDPFDPEAKINGNFLPLYRGHAIAPKYSGLQAL